MEAFLGRFSERSDLERAWLSELFIHVRDQLVPVLEPSDGHVPAQLAAALVDRVERAVGSASRTLPLSYRLVSVSELVTRQRRPCCSNLSWSTNQHREWVREAEQALPNHKALPRASLLLIGCLSDGRGLGRSCDGAWLVRDGSGSVHCEVLSPSPLWLGPPLLFPCWNYIPQHAPGTDQEEPGYLELIGCPVSLCSDPDPSSGPGGPDPDLRSALGVREANAHLHNRSRGRRVQVCGEVCGVSPLLEIHGKPFFCLHLRDGEHTASILVTDVGHLCWRRCVSVGQSVCVSGLRVCVLRCWAGNKVLCVTAQSSLSLLHTHTLDTHTPDTHTHTLDTHTPDTHMDTNTLETCTHTPDTQTDTLETQTPDTHTDTLETHTPDTHTLETRTHTLETHTHTLEAERDTEESQGSEPGPSGAEADTHTHTLTHTHTNTHTHTTTACLPASLRTKFSRVISYKGVVTGVLSEGAGLYVIDGSVGLCLAYQPLEGRGLRPGSEVELHGVHFLFRPCPLSLPSMLCVCLRSSWHVTAFSRLAPSDRPGNRANDSLLPRLLLERSLGVSEYLWLCCCSNQLRERLVPSMVCEQRVCVVGGRLLEAVCPRAEGERGARDIYAEMLQLPHHCNLTEYSVGVPRCVYVCVRECVCEQESVCWSSVRLASLLGPGAESLTQAELNPALAWSCCLSLGQEHHPLPLLLVGLLELPAAPSHTPSTHTPNTHTRAHSSSHTLRLRDQTGDVACVVTETCDGKQRALSNTAWIGCLVCVQRFRLVTERFLQSNFPSYKHLDQEKYITHKHCRVYVQFCVDDVHILSPSAAMAALLEEGEREGGKEGEREGERERGGEGEREGREEGEREGGGEGKREREGGGEGEREGGAKRARLDPAPAVTMETQGRVSSYPGHRPLPATSDPCVSVVMRVEGKEGLAWRNMGIGSEDGGAGLSMCFSVRAELIGPVQRWGRDPRNTLLQEREMEGWTDGGKEGWTDRENSKVVLLFSGSSVRWFPLIQPGSFYRLTSPKTQDPSVLIGCRVAGRGGVELHTSPSLLVRSNWRIHSLPRPLIHPRLRPLLPPHFTQVFPNVLSVSDVLDNSAVELVSFQGLVSKRINLQENKGKSSSQHTHSEVEAGLSVRLTVCDQASRGRSLSVYVDLSHAPYPPGLLPGNTLLFSTFQRRLSRTGGVYCRSLPVSCVTVAALGSASIQCVEPAPMMLLGVWALEGAQRCIVGQVRGHVVCVLYLQLKWTCSLCGCIYTKQNCSRSSPPCSSTSSVFQAEARVAVDDGSGEGRVWFSGPLVMSLLGLATPQWEGLQRSLRVRGHLRVYSRGRGLVSDGGSEDPVLQYLISVCGSSSVCRALTLTCRLHTCSHTRTEDPAQLKRFTRGDREFVTRLPAPLQLTCTHLEEGVA